MEATIVILTVYAILITCKYLQKWTDYQEAFDQISEMHKVINAADPYIEKLTNECRDWKDKYESEARLRKAESAALQRIKDVLKPAEYLTPDNVVTFVGKGID